MNKGITLLNDDCVKALKQLDPDSVDSLVTDPPAGISFMGKEWDSDKGGRDGWIAWMSEVMRECHRVLKPGAHGLVWAIPRTSHWTATALENAGFEVRDVVTHLFGSGFPKSLDISKAIDKAAGAEREVISERTNRSNFDPNAEGGGGYQRGTIQVTAPSTDSAKQWHGWGTALKPASEHWILVRKPLSEKTVASNVLKHGTGGINIDASRIEAINRRSPLGSDGLVHRTTGNSYGEHKQSTFDINQGRFPANLVLSHSPHCQDDQCDIECAILQLDKQSGERKSAGKYKDIDSAKEGGNGLFAGGRPTNSFANETGGASRFFYCAKISTSERNAGLEDMPKKVSGAYGDFAGDGRGRQTEHTPSANHHPTVKPKKLMSYFCKMITPPNGIVLDPFMGSGSTGIAAKECGFKFVGIEREPDYFEIATKRISYE